MNAQRSPPMSHRMKSLGLLMFMRRDMIDSPLLAQD